MRIELFEMERYQSTWEKVVEYDMAESGIRPVTMRELVELGFDLDTALDVPLGYNQTNGTQQLRERIADSYPGATADHILVTNGTSEANFLVALTLLEAGDDLAFQTPNYMQFRGLPASYAAQVRPFRLLPETNWEIDWGDFEQAVNPQNAGRLSDEPEQPHRFRPDRRGAEPCYLPLRAGGRMADLRRGLSGCGD